MPSNPESQLRAMRMGAGISLAALASAARVSERTVRRVEEHDGAPRREVKVRIVAGLNALLSADRRTIEQVFAGWSPHRRHAKRTSKAAARARAGAAA